MKRQSRIGLKAVAILFASATLVLAQANTVSAPAAQPAQPGSVNYVERTALLDDQPLSRASVGKDVVQPASVLDTRTDM
jgi:hypothetical protein